MKQKYYLTLDDEFILFCELNKIEKIEDYAKKLFNEKFISIKYPPKPFVKAIPNKEINKDIIKNKKTDLYGDD